MGTAAQTVCAVGGPARADRRRPAVNRWAVTAACLMALIAGCGDQDDAGDDTQATGPGSTEEITVPADGVELAGTLWLPDGDPPTPAVVIVHGSGPQSRDGVVPGQLGLTLPRPVAVYRELAVGLRDRGYAVATWDKRTCGPFNDCADNDYPTPPDDLAFDTFGDDVGAVLDALAARSDIGELAVVGHSQGGTIAARLTADGTDLAAVVLLATPAVPIDETLAAQAATFSRLIGAAGQEGTPTADAALAEVSSLAGDVAAIASGEVDGSDVGGASRVFWAGWIEASRAAPNAVASTGTPVLAVGGAYDWNVPSEQVQAWDAYLGEGDRLVILPEITHALTRLATDDPAAIGPQDVGTEVDASVIDTIASWLDDTLGR